MGAAALPLAIAGAVGSGVIGAISMVQQGRAAEQQARAQAAWQRYNAKVEEREAEASMASAKFEAHQLAKAGKRLKGKQRAAYASRNLQMEGSPLEVLADTATNIELDKMVTLQYGRRYATQHRTRALLSGYEAGMSEARGAAAKTAGYWGAGSSLLGGVGQGAFYGYMGKK